jgi:hypothetical protein
MDLIPYLSNFQVQKHLIKHKTYINMIFNFYHIKYYKFFTFTKGSADLPFHTNIIY